MAEYIEREAAIREVMAAKWQDGTDGAMAMQIVAAAPAADVAPVRHGAWIPDENDFDDDDTMFDTESWHDWKCIVCFESICYEDAMQRRFLPRYCPNCGALMDGGADNGE